MAKRPEQQELDDFLESIPPAPAPKDLGNFPDELAAAQIGTDPRRPAAPAAPSPEVPVEEAPAEPTDQTPVGEPPGDTSSIEAEPAEPSPPAAPSPEDRLAELEQRLQAQSREMEFLRRGASGPAVQQAPSTDFTPETILPFDVTEQDVQNIVSGGPQSAEAVRNALRATAYSGALAAIRYLTAAYQQTRTQETTAESMRETFWAQNPDLADYPEIVAAAAQQTAAEFPHADAASLIGTTSQRARKRLTQMGVRLGTPQQAAAPANLPRIGRTKTRPATAEMAGGSGRGNGRTTLTAVERDILSLMPR